MAKNIESSNRISFKLFSFCIVLVCLLNIHQVSATECGVANLFADERVLGGVKIRDTEWPFIAALFLTNTSKYFCGGTIISKRHVLTAAHCIQPKGIYIRLSNGDLEVRLGAYNLNLKDEKHTVRRNVTQIDVHEDWDVNREDYDADIAILHLSDNVTFTDYIRPICLPEEDANVDIAYINNPGVIVGWGVDQNTTHETIPKSGDVRALNGTYCFLTYKQTVFLSSARTFCGIGVTPNRGDSGGGFFVDTGLVWAQYGIISAIRTNDAGKVVKTAAVYTNVYMFRSWVMEKIGQDAIDDRVDDGFKEITLNCSYYSVNFEYLCDLRDVDIRSEDIIVKFFTGSHDVGKSDEDVKEIWFRSGTMYYLPHGLGKIFKNLELLIVDDDFESVEVNRLNTRQITRANFHNMNNLKFLYIDRNEIETLPFDTLWDLHALVEFSLTKNKLRVLDESSFERNKRLKRVDLSNNRLEFLPRKIFEANLLLKSIDFKGNLLKLIATDFSPLSNITFIDLSRNICIDKCYSIGSDISCLQQLPELQRLIMSDCSSTNK